MRYCKSCGRELKEGMRFCERCGKSVRQSRDNENFKKQEQIEKLQKERLERKRRQEQRENIDKKRKERKRQKREKYSKAVIIAVAVIAAVIISSIISFIIFSPDADNAASWVKPEMADTALTTALPTMQPSNTIAPIGEVGNGSGDSLGNVSNKDDYEVLRLSNDMEIPYPEVFEEDETTGIQKLNVSDKFGGGATMTVSYEEYPGGTPSELMKEYAADTEGEVTYSLAGSNWYGITVENDGTIIHRKYIIDHTNDCVVYYDFEYSESSDYTEDYENYIEYIDENFDY